MLRIEYKILKKEQYYSDMIRFYTYLDRIVNTPDTGASGDERDDLLHVLVSVLYPKADIECVHQYHVIF